MPRPAPTLLVLVLLGATAAAFAVAEHFKLEQTTILAPRWDRVFSPVCRCSHRTALLTFRLPRRDTVRVSVLDTRGQAMRVLGDRLARRRRGVTFHWNGKTDLGRLVPDGQYSYRIKLVRGARTVVIPYPVTVDTTSPSLRIVSVDPRSLRAGVDGHAGRVKIRYRLTERARVTVFFRGRAVVRGRRKRPRGQLDWYARSGGKALPPGIYKLALVAEDAAGNRSPPAAVTARIRPRSE